MCQTISEDACGEVMLKVKWEIAAHAFENMRYRIFHSFLAAVAQWQSAALKRLASGVRFTPAAHRPKPAVWRVFVTPV